LTGLRGGSACFKFPHPDDASVNVFVRALTTEPTSVRRLIREVTEEDDPKRILALAGALRALAFRGEAKKLEDRVAEKHPDHPGVVLDRAFRRGYAGRWKRVLELLAPIASGPCDPEMARHLHHLLGSALLMEGQPDEAWEVLKRGAALPGRCKLGGLLQLAWPRDRLDELPGELGEDEAPVRRLADAVASADACLARDDLAGARRAVEDPVVWEAQETQSLARFAEVLLREPDAPASRPTKALVLAAFCGASGDPCREGDPRRELPFRHARWDEERLSTLAARARGWLTATFGGE
jgi:hypothetical protein